MNNTGNAQPATASAALVAKPAPRRFPFLQLWPWAAAIASGVMLALCYAPWNKSGLIWFALTPIIAAVWFGKSRRPFALGYVAGTVYFAMTFHWLSSLGELFETPFLLGLPVLLALYLALYPAAWCWFLARILVPKDGDRLFPNSWRNLAFGALAACAWTALEWTRGWMLSGFGWNGLGVALHRDLPMIQIAEVTGVFGLTWLVTFTNVMAVIIVRRILGELGPLFLKRIRWEFSLTISLIVVIFGYGTRGLMSKPPKPDAEINVAVVQPNIPQEQKFDPASEDASLEVLERLTGAAAVTKPDLIVWPESAVPRGMYADQRTFSFIEKLAADLPCPLLAGTLIDAPTDDPPKTYNGVVLVPPGLLEHRPPEYHKVHLVPFGEYLPLRPLLGWMLGGLIPGDIDSGSELKLMNHPKIGDFGVLICFEDTLGNLTRQYNHQPNGRSARLLVNITNDGWFLKTAGLEQHLANSVFRAIENRLPLLRCSNTGVTGLVETNGRVNRWIEPHTQGVALRPVPLRNRPMTFYARWGDWIAWLSLVATIAVGATRFAKRTTPKIR